MADFVWRILYGGFLVADFGELTADIAVLPRRSLC